jgi:DNA processing protein
MTKYGQKVVENFLTEELNDLDVVFVSGLANGIDTQVHSCCLKNGLKTIAVVAGGIDVGYPKSNIELYKQISKEGLVISEYPRGFILEKYMFPRRNRIMVGLSNSVLVIESKAKGGSLITAQLALDYNRDLYAIPGDIDKNSSQGCNILIQAGAFPIASRDDFLRIIGIENGQIKM